MDYGHVRLVISELFVFQATGFPTDYAVLARLKRETELFQYPLSSIILSPRMRYLRQDEISNPANAIDVVPMDVPCGEVREVLLVGLEWPVAPLRVEREGILDYFVHLILVQPPQLQRVVHSAGHDPLPLQVEVRAQYLVPVTLNAAENGDAHISLDVP